MKKLYSIAGFVVLLLTGYIILAIPAEARPFNPVRHQTSVIHRNIRQSLRPKFRINSKYSVPVADVKVSADGKTMVMLGEDNRVHLWNLLTGQKFYSFAAGARITGFNFVPHTQKLIIADIEGVVTVVNFNGIRFWPGQSEKIDHPLKAMALHPKHLIIALAGDNILELWQIGPDKGMERIKSLSLEESVSQLAFSGDGTRLVGVGDKGRLQIWDWQKEEVNFVGQTSSHISSLAVLPDSLMMAAGCENGQIYIVDLSQDNPLSSVSSKTDSAKSLLTGLTFVTAESPYLLGCDHNGSVYKWEIPSGKLLAPFASENDGRLNGISGIPGQKYFLVAGQDHTLKLCTLSDGKVAAKLIVLNEGWGVLAANGCFDGTLKDAPEDHLAALSWFCDEREFTLDGFIVRYYQPALLGHLLAGEMPEPLQGAPVIAEQKQGFPLPPLVSIVKPEKNIKTSEHEIKITLKAVDQDYGLKDIRLYHNGNIVDDKDAVNRNGEKKGEFFKSYRLTLLSGANHFKAVARNNNLIESEPDVTIVNADWPALRPRLHILTVGISKYDNQHLNLHYARQDAEEIGKVLLLKKNPVYSEIIFHHLYDSSASRSAINAQLAALAQLPPQDTVIIYLAGHGETLADEWFFIPYDLRHPENANWLKKSALSSSLLEIYIAGIGARRVFLVIDACKSGALVDVFADFENHRSMALLSRLAGIHVFSASTKSQYAGEFGRLGHGLFTYSMLEGLQGPADCNPANGSVSVSEIMSYVETQMPVLIKNLALPEQQPLANSHGEDFPIIERSN